MAEAEMMAVDASEEKKYLSNSLDQDKKMPKKRKRHEPCLFAATSEEKLAKICTLREEINGLVSLYKELILETRRLFVENVDKVGSSSLQSVIACFMEESDLPLSKLVDEIFEEVKGRIENIESLTKVVVKSTVLMIGQRVCYGVSSVEADVLEDEADCALWCWETRDLKLMPTYIRSSVRVRRACRKKIQDRMSAVSALLSSLENLDDHQNGVQAVLKASEKLDRVLTEANIRLFMNGVAQKNGLEMAGKEAKKQENLLVRQMEKRQRETEKERKKMERQLQKEKLQIEKEQKRLNDEAEKERRRLEKEELELQKQIKRQQEESEKEQRRKEKEEMELKKQLKIQKQASLMERFLKRNKASHDNYTNEATPSDLSSNMVERKSGSVALFMDSVLAQNDVEDANAIWRSHLDSWRGTGSIMRSNKKARWGIRQMPKSEIAKELKLASNKISSGEDVIVGELVDGCVDSNCDGKLCQLNMEIDPLSYLQDGCVDFKANGKSCQHNMAMGPLSNQKQPRAKQLLQFDKCFRPAFYGIWPKRSKVVGPRHPFSKDPDVDYEIDSDEEWEEDEPGESLSDCDKDDADESMEGNLKDDDTDETEDGFFVPDGYLSEDEREQTDEMESDELIEKIRDLPDSEKLVHSESEEFCSLLQKQKYLNTLTEHALKKNKPLVVINFMHEKTTLLSSEELGGAEKVERMCLQTLCILPFPGFQVEIIPVSSPAEDEDLEASSQKSAEQPLANAKAITDAELSQMVSIINSSGHSIGKIVEQLHEKFPAVSKSQLGRKVREISEFSDNRWQVKKEVLSKLGLFTSPGKNGSKAKSIASFFSKRCLPPSSKTSNFNETSPEQSKQRPAISTPQQCNSSNV